MTSAPKYPPLNVAAVEKAAEALKGRIVDTPTVSSTTLAQLTGAEKVYLKLDVLQRTAAFKERGALNKLLSLTAEERARGVITASAGNHAQGVAYHSSKLGIKATIVMPVHTPTVKVLRVKSFGGIVVKYGEVFDEAKDHAKKLAEETGMVMVHPYDDEVVMAGQGTVALEMLRDAPDIDTFVIPIGGGGLIAGVGTVAKPRGIRVIGVQASRFASTWWAVKGGPKPTYGPSTIADGIAVKFAGDRTLPLLKPLVDDIVTVTESDLETAIYTILRDLRTVTEGAGAAGLAAVLANPEMFKGRRVGLVLSGGNIDPFVLSSIIQRGLARAGSMARVALELTDHPGSLGEACRIVGAEGGNIVEVSHQRTFCNLDVHRAKVDIVISTEGREHTKRIIEALTKIGITCSILSDSL